MTTREVLRQAIDRLRASGPFGEIPSQITGALEKIPVRGPVSYEFLEAWYIVAEIVRRQNVNILLEAEAIALEREAAKR